VKYLLLKTKEQNKTLTIIMVFLKVIQSKKIQLKRWTLSSSII